MDMPTTGDPPSPEQWVLIRLTDEEVFACQGKSPGTRMFLNCPVRRCEFYLHEDPTEPPQ